MEINSESRVSLKVRDLMEATDRVWELNWGGYTGGGKEGGMTPYSVENDPQLDYLASAFQGRLGETGKPLKAEYHRGNETYGTEMAKMGGIGLLGKCRKQHS